MLPTNAKNNWDHQGHWLLTVLCSMGEYDVIVDSEAVEAYIQCNIILSSEDIKSKVQCSMSDHVCVHSTHNIMYIPEENCYVIEDVCCYHLLPTITEVSRYIVY